MSVTTKTGDKGQTSLYTGERVDKDDPVMEFLGTGDELVSNLGELRLRVSAHAEDILRIQKTIFRINSYAATKKGRERFLIPQEEVDFLEGKTKEFEGITGELHGFIIPSENLNASKADICRTVARRYERRLITLSAYVNFDTVVRKYVNRLSDMLFMMARVIGKEKD
ncbi:cob(I)yrinic acid a,c-diamide adenosyltransferase [Geovibrio thiophilus]|uniref:Corrinoid adenosyltransferase n=1 Tax=Geovibrio thiophilus TaxID=139438 RepID=A0A3R5UXV4_9BACT|nr:cob(I)yrinic acid a,c-diamide adenosyltransferase [Geovibrio thiophilus]QAR33205.1 cob(I)yrinic acid a,c-diamide adenosyltransferase [Geovibrio thiophilus]